MSANHDISLEALARLAVVFPGSTCNQIPLEPRECLLAAGHDTDDPWVWWEHGSWLIVSFGSALWEEACSKLPDLAERYESSVARGQDHLAVRGARMLIVPAPGGHLSATRIEQWLTKQPGHLVISDPQFTEPITGVTSIEV